MFKDEDGNIFEAGLYEDPDEDNSEDSEDD